MRLAALAALALLAAAPLGAQSADSVKRDTTPPAPGTCVDRDRDRKCDRPEKKGDRVVRDVGETAAPIAKSRISRRKGGTRGSGGAMGPPRPKAP